MYGKCGLIQKVKQVFGMAGVGVKGERKRDIVLWTSMLGLYRRNDHFKGVIRLYQEILMEGIKPAERAFVSLWSHEPSEFREYLESMVCDFSLDPTPEHYSCLIDLLCRVGEVEVVNDCCTVSILGAQLSACYIATNVGIDLAKLAAQRALELDPQNMGIYV
ncbi:hypothetical protein Vadar_000750 [Vaccinium darrowii]|uniref:Uncharacterized protein n=1 Tax=Vaccinium darrowii TaxID=229202 RepID=A0ACB7YB48_9ERIC|nr:hypothetical protein Vadar_000750 [Vaccinium darrowii]